LQCLEHPVYRIVRRIYEPFEPKPWELSGEDGTFGDRFDDPGGRPGRRPLAPIERRFRVIYCATDPVGAFGETIARVRPQLAEIPGLAEIEHDPGNPEAVDAYLHGMRDPQFPDRGILPASWRLDRQLYNTELDPSLVFVDICAPESIEILRRQLAPVTSRLGLTDVDFSTVIGPMRVFTQECARYVYEQLDQNGRSLYAGLRYESRLNPDWDCWAICHDRMVGRHQSGLPETITADHPALHEVAAQFRLSIDVFQGMGHLLRP
jgi:hypothetical protein